MLMQHICEGLTAHAEHLAWILFLDPAEIELVQRSSAGQRQVLDCAAHCFLDSLSGL